MSSFQDIETVYEDVLRDNVGEGTIVSLFENKENDLIPQMETSAREKISTWCKQEKILMYQTNSNIGLDYPVGSLLFKKLEMCLRENAPVSQKRNCNVCDLVSYSKYCPICNKFYCSECLVYSHKSINRSSHAEHFTDDVPLLCRCYSHPDEVKVRNYAEIDKIGCKKCHGVQGLTTLIGESHRIKLFTKQGHQEERTRIQEYIEKLVGNINKSKDELKKSFNLAQYILDRKVQSLTDISKVLGEIEHFPLELEILLMQSNENNTFKVPEFDAELFRLIEKLKLCNNK